jgi:hypothetical protein
MLDGGAQMGRRLLSLGQEVWLAVEQGGQGWPMCSAPRDRAAWRRLSAVPGRMPEGVERRLPAGFEQPASTLVRHS